jgi:uncharacterized protein YfkK (UPF0435 family)
MLLFCATACHKPKIVQATQANPNEIDNFHVNEITFKYMMSKAKISFKDEEMDINATANIRICKDSIIWISVTPALGIEASRCLITRDSVFLIDRINNQFHRYDYKSLAQKINIDLTYSMLEAMLLGNLPVKKSSQDKLSKVPQGDFYLLQQKYAKMDIDNYVKLSSMKLELLQLRESLSNKELKINYTNFGLVDSTAFAFNNLINLTYRENASLKSTSIAIQYIKVELPEKELNFPFNVPPKYSKRQ